MSCIIFAVPPNMDEYLVYEPLACLTHPLARDSLGAACDWWTLRIFGFELPIRAYPYAGVSTSVFYAPLFFLFPSWQSTRFLGLISVLLTVVGFQKLTRVSYLTVLSVVGLSFPLTYQILSDTGPVGFHCVLFAWVPLLIREIDRSPAGRGLRVRQIALGLLIFLGIEQKPFFMAFLPVVAAVGIALALADRRLSRQPTPLMSRLLPAWLVAAIPAALLLSSRTGQGELYFSYLAGFGQSPDPSIPSGFFRHIYQLLANYLGNLVRFAGRNYPVETGGLYSDISVATWVFWLLSAGTLAASRSSKPGSTRIFLAGTLGAIAVLASVRQTWRGHHAVFVLPYLLAALCVAFERVGSKPWRNSLLAGLVATQLILFAWVPFQTPREDASWTRLEVLDYLKTSGLDRSALITHYDWGAYYLSALYGSRHQRAGFLRNVATDRSLAELQRISRSTGLDPVFVGRSGGRHNWKLVEKYFPDLQVIFRATDASGTWMLWRPSRQVPTGESIR